jgi:hypothetical protein
LFHTALRAKPIERKPVSDESKWFAALVATLRHEMHRKLKAVDQFNGKVERSPSPRS